MKKVLVTGATGFVGRHLCNSLVSNGYVVTGTTRSLENRSSPGNYDLQIAGDIGTEIDWGPVLRDVDYVVHLAARVHVISEFAEDPLTEFRRVNLRGSKELAESAAIAGVKRLIYVSTIKVLGEKTEGRPFRHADKAVPCDPYAISKLEAEEALSRIAENKGLELVILRPPLIYGPGVGGNFLRILDLVARGIPLPLGRIRNVRSMLAVSNLCDVIQISLEHPDAAGRTFLLADGADISTPRLVRMIGELMERPVRLLPVPEYLLRLGGKIFRRSNEVNRLCDSLQVDIEHTKNVLDWAPHSSLEDGMRAVVCWYLQKGHHSID
jgi:nucleoside-diphosphate-sugar epimerase